MITRAVLSYAALIAWFAVPALIGAGTLALAERRHARQQARYRARLRLEATRAARRGH